MINGDLIIGNSEEGIEWVEIAWLSTINVEDLLGTLDDTLEVDWKTHPRWR